MRKGFITNIIQSQLRLLAVCGAIVAGQSVYAGEDEVIIYSQIADPSEVTSGYLPSPGQLLSDDFTLESSRTITSLEALGLYLQPVEDSFRVRIYNNSGNLPGALHSTPIIVSASKTYVGTLLGDYPTYVHRFQFEPFTLPAGRYWVSIENMLSYDPQWGWCTGPSVRGMAALSHAGNWEVYAASFSLTIKGEAGDITPPRISSITRQNPLTAVTNADSLTFQVSFNEDVVNVDVSDFIVLGATATVSSVVPITPSVYNVSVSGGSLPQHNGTVSLELAMGQDLADAAGNPLVDTSPVSAMETYVLDNEPPSITIITRTGSSSTLTGPFYWQITYGGAYHYSLRLSDLVPVSTGTVSAQWIIGGSGLSVIVAAYNITGTGSLSFELPAGTATDAAGNPAPASGLAPVVLISDGILDSAGNMLTDGTPTGASEGYTIVFNQAPSAPSLLGPVAFDGDPAKTGRTLSREPVLTWEVPNDEDGDELHFTVQIDTGGGFITVADSAVDETRFTLMFNPNQAFPAVEGEGMVRYRVRPGILYPSDGGVYNWRVIARDAVSSSSYSEMRGMMIKRRPDELENATAGDHRIRLSFLEGLRREVNHTRLFYGWEPYNFSDSTVVANESLVRAVHVIELREALQELPIFWGLTPDFSQGIDAHKSHIKAEDFIEIRNILEGHQAQGDNVL